MIALAQAVYARSLDKAAEEVDFRTFSRRSVANSKALERNVRPVAAAIARFFGPEHATTGLEPKTSGAPSPTLPA